MSEERLKSVFGAVWTRFLEFEITRSKLMCEVAGNPLSALILQVIAYHNLTLVQSAVENKTYGEIRSAWELKDDTSAQHWPQKLSFAAIADITGVDKETVRRSVKKLEAQGWLSIGEKTGISYNPSQINQDKLLILNEWEITHLGRLLKRLNDASNPG
ncbi:helix-turn-helix domain-containing protein [Candidatus Puniceispirillum sp.]|nr:helix-turn-helix domain-containing protein [Candidatus Puniceispirillum sp.]